MQAWLGEPQGRGTPIPRWHFSSASGAALGANSNILGTCQWSGKYKRSSCQRCKEKGVPHKSKEALNKPPFPETPSAPPLRPPGSSPLPQIGLFQRYISRPPFPETDSYCHLPRTKAHTFLQNSEIHANKGGREEAWSAHRSGLTMSSLSFLSFSPATEPSRHDH